LDVIPACLVQVEGSRDSHGDDGDDDDDDDDDRGSIDCLIKALNQSL